MDNEMTSELANEPAALAPPVVPAPAPTAGSTSRRRGLSIGLAAGLLGGTAAGLVLGVPGLTSAVSPSAVVQQATPTGEPTPIDPAPTDRAPAEPDATGAERATRLREELQPLVDAGTITAEQADAVAAHLAQRLPDRPGPHGGHGRGGFPFDGEVLETLGIDLPTLREQLQAGSSLADIAEAQGIDAQTLIDALVAEGSERIDEAAAAGRIDEAEATERKAELETRVTELVNAAFDGSLGDWGGRGPRGGHGPRPDDAAPEATTPDATTPPTTDD